MLEYSRDKVYFGKYRHLFVFVQPDIRINIKNDIRNNSRMIYPFPSKNNTNVLSDFI